MLSGCFAEGLENGETNSFDVGFSCFGGDCTSPEGYLATFNESSHYTCRMCMFDISVLSMSFGPWDAEDHGGMISSISGGTT